MGRRARQRSDRILHGITNLTPEVEAPETTFTIPNYSGTKRDPTEDQQLATKKYVDDNVTAGSGSMTTVKEGGVQVGGADIQILDFGAGFDIAESPDKEINITLDFTEVAGHDNFTDFVANEHIDWTADAGASNIDVNNITAVPEAAVTAHEAAINHDALTNFVANEHIDHTSVTITAGTALTGGGDISANRTINVDQNALRPTILGASAVADNHGTASTDQVINVCYGTSATPPTASTTTEGALYIQYKA